MMANRNNFTFFQHTVKKRFIRKKIVTPRNAKSKAHFGAMCPPRVIQASIFISQSLLSSCFIFCDFLLSHSSVSISFDTKQPSHPLFSAFYTGDTRNSCHIGVMFLFQKSLPVIQKNANFMLLSSAAWWSVSLKFYVQKSFICCWVFFFCKISPFKVFLMLFSTCKSNENYTNIINEYSNKLDKKFDIFIRSVTLC